MKPKVFVLLLALLLLISHEAASSAAARNGKYSEAALRRTIVRTTTPPYPREALESGAQGRVIAAVVFDEDGNLSKIEVLVAPDRSIRQSVIDTLKDWKAARLSTANGRIKLVGWLSFDFTIQGGVGYVEYAEHNNDDDKPDKRYIHPFTHTKNPFYYQYKF